MVYVRISSDEFAGVLQKLTANRHSTPGLSTYERCYLPYQILLVFLFVQAIYLCIISYWSSAHEKEDTVIDRHNGQYSGTSLEMFHV